MPELIRPIPTGWLNASAAGASRPVTASPSQVEQDGKSSTVGGEERVARLGGRLTRVRDRYIFTMGGLRNLRVHDIAVQEVWEVLHLSRRLTRQIGADAAAVFGVTGAGRYLVVLVVESALADEWDVVAAREMDAGEEGVFDRFVGRTS